MLTPTTRTTTTVSGWCARESDPAPYTGLRSVERAWLACRRRKRSTVRACLYEHGLLDNLVATRDALRGQNWRPSPPVVFTVEQPKAREVYAAQFEDRVVHHWLVPQLEAVIDRDFIHDAASNRVGRGSHFAVKRLQSFMRRHQGQGWFLQLDVANFFNSIHHPTLLALLAAKLRKAVRQRGMELEQARLCYRIASRIIRQPCAAEGIRLASARGEQNRVPAHKRLESAPPETGLPIGNLTSQFFANLYLNELDQFVKHELKCSGYVRYVDDCILVHRDREVLAQWHERIGAFLTIALRLKLKSGQILAPVGNGADFLGYIVRPGYLLVRRRVVGNLRERLKALEGELLRRCSGGLVLSLPAPVRERLRATLASYWGHFRHAASHHLCQRIFTSFPWLGLLFRDPVNPRPRWQPALVSSLASQWRYFQQEYPSCLLIIQCGRRLLVNAYLPGLAPYAGLSRIRAWSTPLRQLAALECRLRRYRYSYLFCAEEGFLRGGLKRRVVRRIWLHETPSPRNPRGEGVSCKLLTV